MALGRFRVGSLAEPEMTLTRVVEEEPMMQIRVNLRGESVLMEEERPVRVDPVIGVMQLRPVRVDPMIGVLLPSTQPTRVTRGSLVDQPQQRTWRLRWFVSPYQAKNKLFSYGPRCGRTKEQARLLAEAYRDSIYPPATVALA